jgi:hypothetical protein
VVVVLLEMFGDQCGQELHALRGQMALDTEDFSERFLLVQQSCVHRANQSILGDEIELHRQNAQKKISVG